jgi:hypothetical protein
MTKQEFLEYYKKNKTVVIGVPVILAILLLDTFILKPARIARKKARMQGNKTSVAQPVKTTAKIPTTAGVPAQKAPITPPPPLKQPRFPKLDKRIETRFNTAKVYPYSVDDRNIFIPLEEEKEEIVPVIVEEIVERPDISYHGFFTVGADKVAILKYADEILLSKTGTMLKRSPFKLRSVEPDKVIVEDTSDTDREFEVALIDQSVSSKKD